MKVTIVGAGNVGASCADSISYRGIASEVVLLDIKEGNFAYKNNNRKNFAH